MYKKAIIFFFIFFFVINSESFSKEAKLIDNSLSHCVKRASIDFDLPISMILAIIEVEGGKNGEISWNKNGTYDMGPAQVNSVHLDELKKFGLDSYHIINNPCINIYSACYIIKKHYDKLDKIKDRGLRLAEAAGRYHSKTPYFKERYMRKLLQAVRNQ